MRANPHAHRLQKEHTPEAIAQRIAAASAQGHLGDYVLGAVDGTVTTFAIVSGVAGAGLSPGIALVLGVSNVLADGFSMAVSNYLKSKADADVVAHYRRIEERHIDLIPDGEREEIRQIYAAKGFSGEMLEKVVDVICEDRTRWVDTMLTEEWGLPLTGPPAVKAALATFAAFLAAGVMPLAPLGAALAGWLGPTQWFPVCVASTAVGFSIIGALKGWATQQSLWRGVLETLLIGAVAAALAYLVGAGLEDWAKR